MGSRSRRRTEPLETIDRGVLTEYAEIERYLVTAEIQGRAWAFECSRTRGPLYTPTDDDICELHRVMFGSLVRWAGKLRTADVGPAGIVNVPYFEVAPELRSSRTT